MATTEAGQNEIIAAWTAPIDRDNAAHEVKQISKAWMTLALVQFVIALYCYLLPSIPVLSLSGMPLQHVLYAPALFALGLLYGAFRIRIIAQVIAVVFIVLILGESYFYVTDHMDMIAADRNNYSMALAGIWRLLLLWLSLRGLKAALLAR